MLQIYYKRLSNVSLFKRKLYNVFLIYILTFFNAFFCHFRVRQTIPPLTRRVCVSFWNRWSIRLMVFLFILFFFTSMFSLYCARYFDSSLPLDNFWCSLFEASYRIFTLTCIYLLQNIGFKTLTNYLAPDVHLYISFSDCYWIKIFQCRYYFYLISISIKFPPFLLIVKTAAIKNGYGIACKI